LNMEDTKDTGGRAAGFAPASARASGAATGASPLPHSPAVRRVRKVTEGFQRRNFVTADHDHTRYKKWGPPDLPRPSTPSATAKLV
jgi:hypothetical protein